MASPQKENGYLAIANEIAEAFARNRLSGQEWQVLWAVLRKTYGFNKREDYISLGQIAEMTGISRPKVALILKSLFLKKITGVTQNGNSQCNCLYFQKDYEQWEVLPKKVTVPKKGNSLFPKKVTEVFPKKVPTKDNKDNIKDSSVDTSQGVPKKGNSKPPLTAGEIIAKLSGNPAYSHVNITTEYHKMCAWCEANRRMPTYRTFVNWLNRIERPLPPVEAIPSWKTR